MVKGVCLTAVLALGLGSFAAGGWLAPPAKVAKGVVGFLLQPFSVRQHGGRTCSSTGKGSPARHQKPEEPGARFNLDFLRPLRAVDSEKGTVVDWEEDRRRARGPDGRIHHDSILDMVMKKKDQFVNVVLEMEYQAQLEVAEVLLFFIRKYTNGGLLPSAEGTTAKLDKQQRQILVEFVPEVLRIMDRLEKSGLDDARVYLYGTEALGYDLSLKSTLHAAAYIPRISRNIDMMVTKHPEVNGGAPFIVQGMMNLNAPQPLRNIKKAKECFEAAYKIDPHNARNNYFCGVTAFLQKDFKQAYDYFSRALHLSESSSSGLPWNDGEAVDAYLTSQCRRGIELANLRLSK